MKWVSVLMADAKSCVAYCGWLSEYFAVEAGIRQGCPFSSLAFVLAVELLAIKIQMLEQLKSRAAQLRSRVKWVEQSRANSKMMERVTDDKGRTFTKQVDI